MLQRIWKTIHWHLQQMVAIARAVDMDSKVLILDEPTSSLDDKEVEKLFYHDAEPEGKGRGYYLCYPTSWNRCTRCATALPCCGTAPWWVSMRLRNFPE